MISPRHDVVIIGGGHNGLVCAFYLARAGLRSLVLERRPMIGGVAVTEEIHPGFHCPTLEHTVGPLTSGVARDLKLENHGLKIVDPGAAVFVPMLDGRALILERDSRQSREAIAHISTTDASRYEEWQNVIASMGPLLRQLLFTMPPDLDHRETGSALPVLVAALSFYGLNRETRGRLLRWLTLPVADLVEESFETDALQAVLASRGLDGVGLGPREAGTGFLFLLHAAVAHHPLAPPTTAVGGPGAFTRALADAARAAGAEIRTSATVERITTTDGGVRTVVLTSGEEIEAMTVVSNADPKQTLLEFLSPEDLDPGFRMRLRTYRSGGTVAKVNVALSDLPTFDSLRTISHDQCRSALSGRIHVGPTLDYLDRAADAAKYGEHSREPILDITIPSVADESLAPAGRHVMSIRAQFAPYALRHVSWPEAREELAERILRAVARYAPDLPSLVMHQQTLTPVDIATDYGLTGGHLRHGELALDQLFSMRPLLGWARHRSPIRGLYLCGSGTHPGVGLTGASGANASQAVLRDLRKLR